jgi:hypothetical protein
VEFKGVPGSTIERVMMVLRARYSRDSFDCLDAEIRQEADGLVVVTAMETSAAIGAPGRGDEEPQLWMYPPVDRTAGVLRLLGNAGLTLSAKNRS